MTEPAIRPSLLRRWRIGIVLALLLLATLVGWRWVSRSARDADPQTAPLEWRDKMLRKFEGETLLQAVENLHDVNDWAWASTSYPDGVGPTAFFQYCNRVPPRLTRVRRILGETQAAQKAEVICMLEGQLDRACDCDYRKLSNKEMDAVKGTQVPADSRALWMAHQASPCVYLLTELRSYTSLPLLARIYVRPYNDLAVSRAYLLYGMHLLSISHPRKELSHAARKALDEYREWSKFVPMPANQEVTAWRARREEHDFRIQMGGPKHDLEQERKLTLRLWPESANLEWRELNTNGVMPIGNEQFKRMKAFIDLAYPESK